MSEWEPIETAVKDGRFYDTYNAHNGERRVSQWIEVPEFMLFKFEGGMKWSGWDYQWGNKPTHCKPMPMPSPQPKETGDE